jgi:hypothetical protein
MAQLRRHPSVSELQSLSTEAMCAVARYAHNKDPVESRRCIIAAAEKLVLEARDPLEQLFDLSGQVSLLPQA